jgi:hypothetical protein
MPPWHSNQAFYTVLKNRAWDRWDFEKELKVVMQVEVNTES